jgi:ribose transport system ATP-binding protein
MPTPILEMSNISKSFSGVKVLLNIDFTLIEGEVHAIVGQNGAGKSTLMKILNGVYIKDEGTIQIGGREVDYDDPLGARKCGVSMVFQEFSLVPTLTVSQNVFLGNKRHRKGFLLDDKNAEKRTGELLRDIGVDVYINPREYVENLSVGSRQIVEIAKALSHESKILILDEPTASLSHAEIESLFHVIRNLKDKGISIIYISHYLKDIFKICDAVTVLRDGYKCFTRKVEDTTIDEVIGAMLGKKLEEKIHWERQDVTRVGTPLLEIKHVTNKYVKDISFQLWPGEIIGLAGLLGSGRTEIVRAIFGIDPIDTGEVLINGAQIKIKSTKDSTNYGMALVPEDRRNQGLILDFSIKDNLLLPILRKLVNFILINDRRGKTIVQNYITGFNIKAENIEQTVKFLSGGNQQKVVVAKNMANESKILLLDDPTFGIDVQSKLEIMRIVRDFVNKGNGAILISSELDEIAAYCDKILIVRKGEIVQSIIKNNENEISEELLLKLVQ